MAETLQEITGWTDVTLIVDGVPMRGVSEVSFKTMEQAAVEADEAIAQTLLGQSQTNGAEQGSYAAAKVAFEVDRSKNLLETQTIEGVMRLTPHPYSFSVSIPLSKRKWKMLRHAFDPWRSNLLEHVLRGCGPGGRRNSKMSRKILDTAGPLAWREMYRQRGFVIRARLLRAHADSLEDVLNAELAAQAAKMGVMAPTARIVTEPEVPVDAMLCAAAVGQGSEAEA